MKLAILPFILFTVTNAIYTGGRRGVNPKIYKLDERPVPKRVEFPKVNGQCTVDPWILWMMVNRESLVDGDKWEWNPISSQLIPALQQHDESGPYFSHGPAEDKFNSQKTVLQLLSNCQDNKDFRAIMSIDYLMTEKPETAADAGVSRFAGLANSEVYRFMGLQPGTSLSEWGDSKVFMNLYKWRMYNQMMRGPLFGLNSFQQKFDLYETVKNEAETAHTGDDAQILQMRDWLPFFNFIK